MSIVSRKSTIAAAVVFKLSKVLRHRVRHLQDGQAIYLANFKYPASGLGDGFFPRGCLGCIVHVKNDSLCFVCHFILVLISEPLAWLKTAWGIWNHLQALIQSTLAPCAVPSRTKGWLVTSQPWISVLLVFWRGNKLIGVRDERVYKRKHKVCEFLIYHNLSFLTVPRPFMLYVWLCSIEKRFYGSSGRLWVRLSSSPIATVMMLAATTDSDDKFIWIFVNEWPCRSSGLSKLESHWQQIGVLSKSMVTSNRQMSERLAISEVWLSQSSHYDLHLLRF